MQLLQIQALEMEIETDEEHIFKNEMEVKLVLDIQIMMSLVWCTMIWLFFLLCMVLYRS